MGRAFDSTRAARLVLEPSRALARLDSLELKMGRLEVTRTISILTRLTRNAYYIGLRNDEKYKKILIISKSQNTVLKNQQKNSI